MKLQELFRLNRIEIKVYEDQLKRKHNRTDRHSILVKLAVLYTNQNRLIEKHKISTINILYFNDLVGIKGNLKPLIHRTGKTKPIIQLTIDNKYFNEYTSLFEAEKQTGISQSNISQVATGNNKTAGGFKWVYKENYKT